MNILAIILGALPVFASVVAAAWFTQRYYADDPAPSQLACARIKIRRGIFLWLGLPFSVIFIGVGIWMTVEGVWGRPNSADVMIFSVPFTMMGLYFLIGICFALSSKRDIIWTDDNLSGPGALTLRILHGPRRTFAWSQFVDIGLVGGPYSYAETIDGQRIYWSRIYADYGKLEATLLHKCPHLSLPEFTLYPELNEPD